MHMLCYFILLSDANPVNLFHIRESLNQLGNRILLERGHAFLGCLVKKIFGRSLLFDHALDFLRAFHELVNSHPALVSASRADITANRAIQEKIRRIGDAGERKGFRAISSRQCR